MAALVSRVLGSLPLVLIHGPVGWVVAFRGLLGGVGSKVVIALVDRGRARLGVLVDRAFAGAGVQALVVAGDLGAGLMKNVGGKRFRKFIIARNGKSYQ